MLRNTLHIIAAALLWVMFVYYWSIVLRQPMNPDTRTSLVILSILTGLTVAFLTAWIYHNLRIYRTSDRRKHRRSAGSDPTRDYLDRILVFEQPDALARSNYIEVDVKEAFVSGRLVERKIFKPRAGDGAQL